MKEFTIVKGEESGVTQITTYYASDYATRLYRGYSDGALTSPSKNVPYLLPICVTTLTSSSVLNNDGYGLSDAMMGEGVNVVVGNIIKENY